ncbi:uncharacterized protein J3D65DRAFT_360177 [Phyllosticta citribraziliensis]|uniref:Secreted protein n=1 Tax=Phyllosticta citribraziliensis TaxID=989973 RepID=A0ABR1LR46_9PEZI
MRGPLSGWPWPWPWPWLWCWVQCSASYGTVTGEIHSCPTGERSTGAASQHPSTKSSMPWHISWPALPLFSKFSHLCCSLRRTCAPPPPPGPGSCAVERERKPVITVYRAGQLAVVLLSRQPVASRGQGPRPVQKSPAPHTFRSAHVAALPACLPLCPFLLSSCISPRLALATPVVPLASPRLASPRLHLATGA